MPVFRTIRILLVLTAIAALALWFAPDLRWLLFIVVAGCLGALIVLHLVQSRLDASGGEGSGRTDDDDMSQVDLERRRELVRGTSLYLREMRYRYSIRIDETDAPDRRPFTADVNEVRLGFIPSILLENTTDRQGLGYLAFVYDGTRWRGPGLPCPGPSDAAVNHAAKCVEPIDDFEDSDDGA